MHDLKMHFIFHHLQVQRLHAWVQSKVDFQINPLLLTENLGRQRKIAHNQSAYDLRTLLCQLLKNSALMS